MIKLFFCGDFRATDATKIVVEEGLLKLINNSDFTVCNFEAPVASDGEAIEKSGPVLDQAPQSAFILKSMGFNIILLANNHIMDHGKKGCEETLNAFSDVICVGAGKASDAYKVKIVEKDGKKIGFLALVQHEFGVVESAHDLEGYGTAWINSPDVEEIIKEVKQSIDYLIVFPHCGVEHIDAPLPEWRERYKKLVHCGADVVVASHPHCQQGWEVYEGKYIYYSLGNFYFDGLKHGDKWYRSLAVEVNIDKYIQTKEYCLKFNDAGNIGFDNSLDTRTHVQKICHLLENTKLYNDYIERICREEYDNNKYNILRGIGGFTPHIRFVYALRLLLLMLIGEKREMTLLNMFQNESLRWLLERQLRIKDQ